jgi:hypothetical protein
MGIDDCAIIPDEFTYRNAAKQPTTDNSKKQTVTASTTTGNEKITSNDKSPTSLLKQSGVKTVELTVDQLKSGFTAASTLYATGGGVDKKELTFVELYQSLNKLQPTSALSTPVIKFKYDWIVTLPNDPQSAFTNATSNVSPNQPINMFSYFYSQHNPLALNNNNNNASVSSSSAASLFTLSSFHSQQQRFYIDTLASVAASFLNDLQKPKNASEAGGASAAGGYSQASGGSGAGGGFSSQLSSKAANAQSNNQHVIALAFKIMFLKLLGFAFLN